LCFCR
ncbi:2-aminoethylphosphonate--pyruvate transaminase domain protein, partial [Vibrio parahaemolyticus V-223/04]